MNYETGDKYYILKLSTYTDVHLFPATVVSSIMYIQGQHTLVYNIYSNSGLSILCRISGLLLCPVLAARAVVK